MRDDLMAGFLTQMEYPCTKDDLLREARRESQPPVVIDRLRLLEDSSFPGMRAIRSRLA